ncbi:hypothetical protein [Trichothermofontia sp.]
MRAVSAVSLPMRSEHLTLNLNEGSVAFHFTPQAAQTLQAAIADLMNTLKANVANPSPKTTRGGSHTLQRPPMEYRYTGDVFLELFCNPNIWPSPFAAKVLLTLRDDHIQLTTEIALSQLQEDLNQYLEQGKKG